jgi:DNA-binding transcriptional ArsR family regulator
MTRERANLRKKTHPLRFDVAANATCTPALKTESSALELDLAEVSALMDAANAVVAPRHDSRSRRQLAHALSERVSRIRFEKAQREAVVCALAHPARRQILMTIHFRGKATAGEIAGRFAHKWPTTTRHLRVLEHAGLIGQSLERMASFPRRWTL